MKTAEMPRVAAFYRRTLQAYENMKRRFGPRYWKSGKRKGQMKDPGRELPFSVQQFREWYVIQLGGSMDGAVRCPYCPAYITALDARLDHKHPVAQGGSLGLDNLCLCCDESNRLKGNLTVAGYRALEAFLDGLGETNPYDAADIRKRLKGGVLYHKTKEKAKNFEPTT